MIQAPQQKIPDTCTAVPLIHARVATPENLIFYLMNHLLVNNNKTLTILCRMYPHFKLIIKQSQLR